MPEPGDSQSLVVVMSRNTSCMRLLQFSSSGSGQLPPRSKNKRVKHEKDAEDGNMCQEQNRR